MQAGILGRAIGLLGSKQGLPEREVLPAPTGIFRGHHGKRLAYDEYGSLHGYPLIFFHDAGSSRLECAGFHKAARKCGYRLVAVDRPGIGGSDFYPLRNANAFCADILRLADHLRLQKFGVMSLGAGGVYAATLAHLAPRRVSTLLGLGGIPGVAFNESAPESLIASCVQGLTPACMQLLARIRHGLMPGDPEHTAMQLEEMLSVTDRKSLAAPRLRQMLALDRRESLRQGARGVAQDIGVCYRKFDFQLGAIQVPTVIWQGAADRLSSRADSEFLVSRIPSASYYRVANRGHFFFIHCMEEVFGRLQLHVARKSSLAA